MSTNRVRRCLKSMAGGFMCRQSSRRWHAAFAAVFVLFAVDSTAMAASYSWNAMSGDWSIASNWSASSVPDSSVTALIANGGTASIGLNGQTCDSLYLGDPNSAKTGAIQMSGGALTPGNNEYVGNYGAGTFNQSGGTNNITNAVFSGSLYLGCNSGGSGVYNLSGSGVLSTVNEYVGYSGGGTLNQSGGTSSTNFFGGLYVGYNPGSNGVYNLSGSGNCNLAWPSALYLGYNAASSGVFNLSGSGLLSATTEYVGNSGGGTFAQTGGTNNPGTLYVANNGGSQGLYNLSAAGLLTASTEYVGNSGSGQFVQSGGTNSVSSLYFGSNTSSSGSYSLSGSGMLIATNEYVGNSGNGQFVQSGGTNSASSLYLGYNTSSSGSYSLSGSGMLTATNEYVGNSGSGAFTQSGGSNATGLLTIGSLGRYQFSGGTLNVGALASLGVFDVPGGAGLLKVGGNSIVDLSHSALAGVGAMSVSIGPNTLLILPAGFDPASFRSFSNLGGVTHNAGTPLSVSPLQSIEGTGAIADFVSCQGWIAAVNGPLNLNGGISVAGMGHVNLGNGAYIVDIAASGISGGSLAAGFGYVGYAGSGVFTQSGGTSTNTGTLSNGGLFLGYSAGASGIYNLSAGSLSNTQYVGYSGVGALNQSGGTNQAVNLYVGYNAGSSGNYVLSGSGLLYGNEYVGYSGSGTFNQSGGSNSAAILSIGSQGRYLFSGGTLGVVSLNNHGVFDATQSMGLLDIAGNQIADLSQGIFVNTGSMSLNVGANSLLLVPAGFDPSALSSYNNQGILHAVGTPLTIPSGQAISGSVNLNDFLNCQGAMTAPSGGAINLNGGVSVSGTGNVNLGSSGVCVNDVSGGVAGGSLKASIEYVGKVGADRSLSRRDPIPLVPRCTWAIAPRPPAPTILAVSGCYPPARNSSATPAPARSFNPADRIRRSLSASAVWAAISSAAVPCK